MDEKIRKQTLRMIPYGLYVLTSRTESGVNAATVSWLSQASFEPPRIVVGLRAETGIWQRVRAAGAFAVAYLLAPALQGALLSDFHAVSMTASLLLFVFYFLHAHRYGAFLTCMFLSALAKEDIPLLVAAIGAYAFAFAALIAGDRREKQHTRWVGAVTTLIGLG